MAVFHPGSLFCPLAACAQAGRWLSEHDLPSEGCVRKPVATTVASPATQKLYQLNHSLSKGDSLSLEYENQDFQKF